MDIHLQRRIEWKTAGEPRVECVLWIEQDGSSMWTIDEKDKKAWPVFRLRNDVEADIKAGRACLVPPIKRYKALLLPGDKYTEKHKERAKRNYLLIAPLVEAGMPNICNRKERGRLIAELAKSTGRRKAQIYTLLRAFLQGGCTPYAVYPSYYLCGLTQEENHQTGEDNGQDFSKKRGRPSKTGRLGRNITAKDREKFKKGVFEFWLSGRARNLKEAWRLTKEKHFRIGSYETKEGSEVPLLPPDEDLPSFYQFEYYYRKHRDIKKEIEGREGSKEYEKNVRPVTGNSTQMAFGPGMIYQIDATVGDIYLVSFLDRTLLIGRPVIYIAIDVFSRLIVGFAVTLEGPSWEGAKQALECAFLNKVEFCKKYGVEITQDQWDVEGRCEALLGDNGEIAGYNPDSLVDPLGIRVATTPTDRPDLKGIVENKFLLVKETVIWIPGAVRPRRRVRGKDYRLEAVLDINQFCRLMIECILFYNNHRYLKKYRMDKQMIADKVVPIPQKLWEYGMKTRTGRLREVDPDVVRLNLQHKGEASVTPEGIRFQGLYYTCERAVREQWFTRIKGRSTRHVKVVRGPLVDTINLRLDKGKSFEECVLTDADKRFEGCDWYDVLEYFALKSKAAAEAESGLHQSAAEYHAKADRIVSEAKEMTKAALAGADLSNSERTHGIRENRKRHKAYERRQASVGSIGDTSQDQSVSEPATSLVPRLPAPAGYVPPAHPHDELRAAREKVRKHGK